MDKQNASKQLPISGEEVRELAGVLAQKLFTDPSIQDEFDVHFLDPTLTDLHLGFVNLIYFLVQRKSEREEANRDQ